MELGGSGKTLAKGRNRQNEQLTEKGFERQIFGWPRLVGHDGFRAFRMVRREAPPALRGRGRIRQSDPGRLMPALRVGERQEGRPLEENGPNRKGMQRLREEIRTLAGTAFDSRKIPLSEWIGFSAHLFQFHSVKTASLDNRNADSTGRYWLSKVFAVVEGIQEGASLSGDVWIDETCFPKWRSESETRGGKRLRGLSRNQFCVLTATDGETCVLRVCGVGKPSAARAVAGYGEMIAEGSKIIHDGDKPHNALTEAMGLSSEVHGADEAKGLADSENPMEPVNEIHRYLSGLVGSHRGFSRGGLQDG